MKHNPSDSSLISEAAKRRELIIADWELLEDDVQSDIVLASCAPLTKIQLTFGKRRLDRANVNACAKLGVLGKRGRLYAIASSEASFNSNEKVVSIKIAGDNRLLFNVYLTTIYPFGYSDLWVGLIDSICNNVDAAQRETSETANAQTPVATGNGKLVYRTKSGTNRVVTLNYVNKTLDFDLGSGSLRWAESINTATINWLFNQKENVHE